MSSSFREGGGGGHPTVEEEKGCTDSGRAQGSSPRRPSGSVVKAGFWLQVLFHPGLQSLSCYGSFGKSVNSLGLKLFLWKVSNARW